MEGFGLAGLITQLESGRRRGSAQVLARIARALGVDLDDLIRAGGLARARRQSAAFGARLWPTSMSSWFEPLVPVSMLDVDPLPRAVANYQTLRGRGITPGTVDMIIGTYCIEAGAELLTADRDFAPMRNHLGLRLLEAG